MKQCSQHKRAQNNKKKTWKIRNVTEMFTTHKMRNEHYTHKKVNIDGGKYKLLECCS